MERTTSKKIGNILINCFSKEGQDLLQLIRDEYAKFSNERKDISDITGYSLAYWLIRYSGLIEPTEKAKSLLTQDSKKT